MDNEDFNYEFLCELAADVRNMNEGWGFEETIKSNIEYSKIYSRNEIDMAFESVRYASKQKYSQQTKSNKHFSQYNQQLLKQPKISN